MSEYRREKSKICPGFEVDTNGVIYGKTGKPLIRKPNRQGYIRVLYTMPNGRAQYYYAHRLIAEQFLDKPEGRIEVNHKNGDPSDNRVENLEWVTHSENMLHSYRVLGHTYAKTRLSPMKTQKPVVGYNGEKRLYFPSEASAGLYIAETYGLKSGEAYINLALRKNKPIRGYYWEYISLDEYEQHKDDTQEGTI